ncbi:hypothetical protein G6M89_20880 [Natronolimnobius sp. AArcel1]|uniref:hypothetical protein n=1 Tax=Natronolimnobius sp. AArcel1 TaxID=1679093 RepID=UPI0013E9A197|nr:hypothetical protein [Natronolimnobius sp. AArcel1]NGM71417.1 hypothetical protein [Natronolimnobius sp. AArcel1]
MTRIQPVHWELEMDYIGHPYYVSGNAILHALGQHVPHESHQHLHASHGMFVPGQFGQFPDEHSQSGVRPYLGSGLPDVESYEDLFLMRNPAHRWLLDSRPRDALNTHDIRPQSGHPALAHEMIMGKPEDAQYQHQTTKWYIHAYLHADDPAVLPLDEAVLDGLQFGGKRNYGYGITRLKETRVVDLEEIDYSSLEESETFILELVTPFVLESEYANVHDQDVPWWWKEDRSELRERKEKILEQREVYRLQTVDHGQVVSYDGNRPVKTAKSGILRVGSHSKYGFGELRVIPVESPSERTTRGGSPG